MDQKLYTGCGFIALMGVVGVIGLAYLPKTLSSLETPKAPDVLEGKWPLQFEKSFRETLPVSSASRDVWGRGEFAVFHQGRKGVVVGTDGWLFTDEEFSCPADYKRNLIDNLNYIYNTRDALARANTQLAVVIVPAKSRVLAEHLGTASMSSCRAGLYTELYTALVKSGITVTNMLSAMKASPMRQELYLKTDTHWSPAGAQLAAQAVAAATHDRFKDLVPHTGTFSAFAGGAKEIHGDLAGYMPGVPVPAEHIASYVSGVAVANAGTGQGLFDDATPPITLVGTSYSANPNWNFEGFLKQAFGADVLNAADQGLGPFVVMDKYLQNDAWKQSPPRLVVWEIPERYLLMPHGVSK